MMETLSINSLYIHFPFCRHLCNYCDFFKNVPKNKEAEFNDFHSYLSESFHVHDKLLSDNGYAWDELETLYIGGGTPSLWGKDGAFFLKNFLLEKGVHLDSECEFTLEVNPGTWTEEGLQKWREAGVNRYSLGIQSLNSNFIKILDRIHSLEDVFDTLDFFSKEKANFSVDFMLGLPSSKELKRDVIAELNEILKYNPPHISLYILTTKAGYIHNDKLPDEEWIEAEYLKVSEHLQKHGFNHYEVSNFAKPGYESKHNLNYWKSKSVAALGPSATGLLAEKGVRYKWKTQSPNIVEEKLSESDMKLEKFYMNFRCFEGIRPRDFFDGQKLEDFHELAKSWENKGYLSSLSIDRVTLSSKGYLIIDSLLNEVFILDKDF